MSRKRLDRQTANLRRVLERIDDEASQGDWQVTQETIKQLNWMCLDGIPEECHGAGMYRENQAVVLAGDHRVAFLPPPSSECAELMGEFTRMINVEITRARSRLPAAFDALHIAALACSRLIEIHPFPQGNGRTSRALAMMILRSFGYVPLPLTTDHYKIVSVKTLEWYFDQHLSDYYAGLHAARRGYYQLWTGIFADAVGATMASTNRSR